MLSGQDTETFTAERLTRRWTDDLVCIPSILLNSITTDWLSINLQQPTSVEIGGLNLLSSFSYQMVTLAFLFCCFVQFPHHKCLSWTPLKPVEGFCKKNKKLEYRFLAESTKIENALFPYKTVVSETNVKTNRLVSTKRTYHKEWSFASNYFIFLKVLFQFTNLV